MLTPIEIQNKTFKSGIGFDRKDVELFFKEVLSSYEQIYKENLELQDKIGVLSEGIQYYKSIEKTLQKALVLAEKTSDDTKKAAVSEATHIEKEAKSKAKMLITDAEHELNSIHMKTMSLVQQYNKYKAQFKQLAATQLELLDGQDFHIDLSSYESFDSYSENSFSEKRKAADMKREEEERAEKIVEQIANEALKLDETKNEPEEKREFEINADVKKINPAELDAIIASSKTEFNKNKVEHTTVVESVSQNVQSSNEQVVPDIAKTPQIQYSVPEVNSTGQFIDNSATDRQSAYVNTNNQPPYANPNVSRPPYNQQPNPYSNEQNNDQQSGYNTMEQSYSNGMQPGYGNNYVQSPYANPQQQPMNNGQDSSAYTNTYATNQSRSQYQSPYVNQTERQTNSGFQSQFYNPTAPKQEKTFQDGFETPFISVGVKDTSKVQKTAKAKPAKEPKNPKPVKAKKAVKKDKNSDLSINTSFNTAQDVNNALNSKNELPPTIHYEDSLREDKETNNIASEYVPFKPEIIPELKEDSVTIKEDFVTNNEDSVASNENSVASNVENFSTENETNNNVVYDVTTETNTTINIVEEQEQPKEDVVNSSIINKVEETPTETDNIVQMPINVFPFKENDPVDILANELKASRLENSEKKENKKKTEEPIVPKEPIASEESVEDDDEFDFISYDD